MKHCDKDNKKEDNINKKKRPSTANKLVSPTAKSTVYSRKIVNKEVNSIITKKAKRKQS